MPAAERKSIRDSQMACAALRKEQRAAATADALQADALDALTANEVMRHMMKVHITSLNSKSNLTQHFPDR